jgi:hypothetical protein
MCGDYNSVIGMQKDEPLRRFITGMPKERFTPASEEATLSGVMVETDDKTGAATKITPIRVGGRLQDAGPHDPRPRRASGGPDPDRRGLGHHAALRQDRRVRRLSPFRDHLLAVRAGRAASGGDQPGAGRGPADGAARTSRFMSSSR